MKKGETMNNEKMTLKNVFSFEGCYTKKQYWVMRVGSLFGLVVSMLMLVVSKESEYEVILRATNGFLPSVVENNRFRKPQTQAYETLE